ncbi:hypothetical protein NU219Hw_g4876t1 [Hortaea werneckii]
MIAKDKKNRVEARPELAQKAGVQRTIVLESGNVAGEDENGGNARHVELTVFVERGSEGAMTAPGVFSERRTSLTAENVSKHLATVLRSSCAIR